MKTRAFDPETKRWRTDYVVMPKGKVYATINQTHRFPWKLYDPDIYAVEVDWKLSRFTGLVDLKDTEVYEHHILDDGDGRKYVVEWDQENCRFRLREPKPVLNISFYYAFDDHIVTYMTVVGDIFTTPKLLEV